MLRLWNNEHYKTKQPEYAKWFKHWVTTLYVIDIAYVLIMVGSLWLWFRMATHIRTLQS